MKTNSKTPLFFPFIIASSDVSIFFLYFYAFFSPLQALSIHLILFSLTLQQTISSYRQKKDIRFLLLFLLSFIFLGPLGVFASFLSALLYYFFSFFTENFEEWHTKIISKNKKSKTNEICTRAQKSSRQNLFQVKRIIPFLDVLSYGNKKQKQKALTLIAKKNADLFIPVLKRYLKDEDISVRVLATSILLKKEKEYSELSEKLSEKNAQKPLSIAEFHEKYASSHLLNESDRKNEWKKALEIYKREIKKQSSDKRLILHKICYIFCKNKDIEKVRYYLKNTKEEEKSESPILYLKALAQTLDWNAFHKFKKKYPKIKGKEIFR